MQKKGAKHIPITAEGNPLIIHFNQRDIIPLEAIVR